MKVIKSDATEKFNNTDIKHAVSVYPLGDTQIDCAFATTDGEFPGGGAWASNEKSKELLFCTKGNGILEIKRNISSDAGRRDSSAHLDKSSGGVERYEFSKDDVILIEPGDVYRYHGPCSFVVVCTPPWTPEQHKKIE